MAVLMVVVAGGVTIDLLLTKKKGDTSGSDQSPNLRTRHDGDSSATTTLFPTASPTTPQPTVSPTIKSKPMLFPTQDPTANAMIHLDNFATQIVVSVSGVEDVNLVGSAAFHDHATCQWMVMDDTSVANMRDKEEELKESYSLAVVNFSLLGG
eukprot:scaffold278055_cov60-Attheya_sp.AAC.1